MLDIQHFCTGGSEWMSWASAAILQETLSPGNGKVSARLHGRPLTPIVPPPPPPDDFIAIACPLTSCHQVCVDAALVL